MSAKHKNLPNPEFSKAMAEIRRSSATQRHTLKKFKGSRQDRKAKAIREAY